MNGSVEENKRFTRNRNGAFDATVEAKDTKDVDDLVIPTSIGGGSFVSNMHNKSAVVDNVATSGA